MDAAMATPVAETTLAGTTPTLPEGGKILPVALPPTPAPQMPRRLDRPFARARQYDGVVGYGLQQRVGAGATRQSGLAQGLTEIARAAARN